MGLEFIFGSSGSGKSEYVYKSVIDTSIKYPDKKIIVMVPDQDSVQVENKLCTMHPSGGILNIDVLGFGRFAYHIFEETGGLKSTVLDDEGKNLILRRVAGKLEGNLKVLKGNLKKQGYISEVKSIISEFKQYGIGVGDLDELMDNVDKDSFLYYKLSDLIKVYDGFEEYLSDKYITGEDLFNVLATVVPRAESLKGSIIYLDGFTGFTPVQVTVLKELLKVCEDIKVTVLMDEREDPFKYNGAMEVFSLGKQMVNTLVKAASEVHVMINDPVYLTDRTIGRFNNNPSIDFLERNLFRYSGRKYEKDTDSLKIFVARSPKEETELAASNVRCLLREKNLRYKDIGIVMADAGMYAPHIERAFEKNGIPVFIDNKKSILLNSFVEYLRSLLAMVEDRFSYDSIFRFLRTGMTDFSMEDVDILENYCLACGIRGFKEWQKPWEKTTRQNGEEELEILNHLRVQFVEDLSDIQGILTLRHKTVEDITRALYEYIVKNKLEEKIYLLKEQFEKSGDQALAKEYSQIYRIVMSLFDKFVLLLGDAKVSLKDYSDLLDAGLEEARVGVIPPGADTVIAGDIQRTRLSDIKALIFLGANDTLIPGNLGQGGLISGRDKEIFQEFNMPLSPGVKEKTYIQKMYLYMNLTKPSDYVYVSYSKVSSDGKTVRPSYLISELKRMYPLLEVKDADEFTNKDMEFTFSYITDAVIRGLRDIDKDITDEWKEMYSYLMRSDYRFKDEIFKGAFLSKEKESISKDTAENLYGSENNFSVTRLEKFASCPYAHFLDYGLRLSDREEYGFEPMDLGNIAHKTLELFSRKAQDMNLSWSDMDEETRNALVEQCVEETVEEYDMTILKSSSRNKYMVSRIKRLMKRSVWALTCQLSQGDFVPDGFEMNFGSGKIDRIDTCTDDNKVFVKVTDYKTGAKVFDITAFYNGLSLQLPVYLNAALNIQKKKQPLKDIIPAGIFYYRIKDPIVDKADDETVTKNILNELKLDGLVNSDDEVIEHLEHGLSGSSIYIPVAKKKSGEHYKYSRVLPPEDFDTLLKYTKYKEKEIKKEIKDGVVMANPYALGTQTGCDYCPYMDICGFDPDINGCEYRVYNKMESEEAIKKMRRLTGEES